MRNPARCADSLESEKSDPSGARTSCRCTGLLSRIVRLDTKLRLIGTRSSRPLGRGPWCATRRTNSPSRKSTVASYAPHTRTALIAMVFKTGWRSVGELEIARRISLVAVCWSSASVRSRLLVRSSLNQPHVLDGDHSLIREGLEHLDLLR